MWETNRKKTKKVIKEFNKQFYWDAPEWGEEYISLETETYAQNKHKPVYFSSQSIQQNNFSEDN